MMPYLIFQKIKSFQKLDRIVEVPDIDTPKEVVSNSDHQVAPEAMHGSSVVAKLREQIAKNRDANFEKEREKITSLFY